MGVSTTDTQVELKGRRRETATIERALADARTGTSAVIVIRGEAGIGKTALLDHAASQARGFRLATVCGVESEMELPYAALHQLCTPLLEHLPHLPAPQREAMSVAFGQQTGDTPDRFMVGLAILGLLSGAADEPLAWLIDDAHWVDDASLQVLAFVARRLQAERVAMIFAVREPAHPRPLPGLVDLAVPALSDADARSLLAAHLRMPLDPQVRDRVVAEARGNPLALLQVPRALSPADLAGGFWLPEGRSTESDLERCFAHEVHTLPTETQRLLLTAAADPTGDTRLVWRAAHLQAIPTAAAAPAEAAGLIEFGRRAQFRHPIVRSAIYRRASVADRRAVHHALAEATDPHLAPDRRAFHRARAATQPDERVAEALEQSADRARRRGGAAATAAFLRWATELTPDPARRITRALAAARAAFDLGAFDQAHHLLADAEAGPLDDLQRAELERLRARLVHAQIRGADTARRLLSAATRLRPLDTALARDTLLEAAGAAIFAGRLGRGAHEVAHAARECPAAPQPDRVTDTLLDAVTRWILDGHSASADAIRHALHVARREQATEHGSDPAGWLLLLSPLTPEPLAPEVWDDDAWHELATGATDLARRAGALSVLPLALTHQACYHVHAGELDTAATLIDEAAAISHETGSTPLLYTSLLLHAWHAAEQQVLDTIEHGINDVLARGEGRALAIADYASAVLYNGLGRYDSALAAALRVCEHEDMGIFGWALSELVEVAARAGQRDTAQQALERLTPRTRASATAWAAGIEARCRAVLADGTAADALFRESIEHLGHTRISIQLARAHLLYGEWLRRHQRRQESRMQLRTAYEAFTRAGAAGFADRARRELTATGETVRKRSVSPLAALTGQEAEIARLARDGHTNPEIAAQLFISPRTVEWHLGNVFTKLGVSSRRHLPEALPAAESPAAV